MTTVTAPTGDFVQGDSRNRITIPGVSGRQYLRHIDADGTIRLTPAAIVSQSELRYLHSPDVQAAVALARSRPGGPRGPRRTS